MPFLAAPPSRLFSSFLQTFSLDVSFTAVSSLPPPPRSGCLKATKDGIFLLSSCALTASDARGSACACGPGERRQGGGQPATPVHCCRRYADVVDALITRTVFISIATAPYTITEQKKTVVTNEQHIHLHFTANQMETRPFSPAGLCPVSSQ